MIMSQLNDIEMILLLPLSFAVCPHAVGHDRLPQRKERRERESKKGTRGYNLFVFLLFFPKLVIVPHFLLEEK